MRRRWPAFGGAGENQFSPDCFSRPYKAPLPTPLLGPLPQVLGDSSVPVIMVTAKGHERDVLNGLRGGAVDYVVKPFSLKELAARVELALEKEVPPTTL